MKLSVTHPKSRLRPPLRRNHRRLVSLWRFERHARLFARADKKADAVVGVGALRSSVHDDVGGCDAGNPSVSRRVPDDYRTMVAAVFPSTVPTNLPEAARSGFRALNFGFPHYTIVLFGWHNWDHRQRYEDGRLRSSQLEQRLSACDVRPSGSVGGAAGRRDRFFESLPGN